MIEKAPLYKPGQIVRHKKYGYRGVITSVDPICQAPDEWYYANRTQPDRDQPWYHVLVSDTTQVTYPAETSLLPDESCLEVNHPLIPHFFERFEDGRYIRNQSPWSE